MTILRRSKAIARKIISIELQKYYSKALNNDGINFYNSLDITVATDTVFMVHYLEQLPDPLLVLRSIFRIVSEIKNGK